MMMMMCGVVQVGRLRRGSGACAWTHSHFDAHPPLLVGQRVSLGGRGRRRLHARLLGATGAAAIAVVLFVIPVVLVARVPARAPARVGPSRAPLAHACCAIPHRIDPRRRGRIARFLAPRPHHKTTKSLHCVTVTPRYTLKNVIQGLRMEPCTIVLETTATTRRSRGLNATQARQRHGRRTRKRALAEPSRHDFKFDRQIEVKF